MNPIKHAIVSAILFGVIRMARSCRSYRISAIASPSSTAIAPECTIEAAIATVILAMSAGMLSSLMYRTKKLTLHAIKNMMSVSLSSMECIIAEYGRKHIKAVTVRETPSSILRYFNVPTIRLIAVIASRMLIYWAIGLCMPKKPYQKPINLGYTPPPEYSPVKKPFEAQIA